MGPNGSGKSTLSNVLAGREGYRVTDGSVMFNELDLLALAPEERAREGIFLAFQMVFPPPTKSMRVLVRGSSMPRTGDRRLSCKYETSSASTGSPLCGRAQVKVVDFQGVSLRRLPLYRSGIRQGHVEVVGQPRRGLEAERTCQGVDRIRHNKDQRQPQWQH